MSLKKKNNVLIIGSGRQAKVTIEIIASYDSYNIVGIVDEVKTLKYLFNYPIIGSESIETLSKASHGIIAVGSSKIRLSIKNKVQKINKNFNFINAIHKTAIISESVEIQSGVQIMAGAIVNASSIIKKHTIINTNANIDHDCIISDYVNVNPGVSIGGNVTIGKSTTIGIGSSVIHDIKIGNNTLIGAGANVVENIPSNVLAYGNPCRVIRELNELEIL